MNQGPPAWISAPTHRQRQTETYRQWRILMRERLLRHPPFFLSHLSKAEIGRILDSIDAADGKTGVEESPSLVVRLSAYERQSELISWSYFSLVGEKLKALQERLSPDDLADTLNRLGLSLEEARLAVLVAETRENEPLESVAVVK